MEISKYINNGFLKVKVVPNSSKNDVIVENNCLKIYIKAVPDKNKANTELIKFFKKKFGLRTEIVSGMKGRDKVLKVLQ